jgi:8-oxo-dGTP diphosphatase
MNTGVIGHVLIFNEKREFLIIQRLKNDNVLPGYWDIPGGTIEDRESIVNGVRREAREETGLEISNPSLFFHTWNIDERKAKCFIRMIFLAKYDGDPSAIRLDSSEHEACAWIAFDDVKKYQLVEYLHDCFATLQNKQHAINEFFDL